MHWCLLNKFSTSALIPFYHQYSICIESVFNLHWILQHKLPHGLSCAAFIIFSKKFIDINFSLQPLSETEGSISYFAAKNQGKTGLGLNLSDMSSNFGSPWRTSRADFSQYSEMYRPLYVHLSSKSALTVILNISEWYKSGYRTLKVIWKSQVVAKLMNVPYEQRYFWKEDDILFSKVMCKCLNYLSAVFI